MTYGAFLAIPPMLLLLVVGASLFFSAPDLQTKVVEVVNGFIPGLAEALPSRLKLDPAGQLWVGLIRQNKSIACGATGIRETSLEAARRVEVYVGT